MCESNAVETLGITDEYDVQSHLNTNLMSRGAWCKVPKNSCKAQLLGGRFRGKRGFQVDETT